VASIPEGAQRSEDGHWWWDESQQQWQPVPSTESSSSSATPGEAPDPAAEATYAEAQTELSYPTETSLDDAEIAEILQRAGVSDEATA
jgi:hypothetical protein